MATEEVPAWQVSSGEEGADCGPLTPTQMREHLAGLPKPSAPTIYDTTEVDFWRHRHLPAGSVIEFVDPDSDLAEPPHVAVLVIKTESLPTGLWLSVKCIGSPDPQEKKRASGYFRGGRRKIHICSLVDGECPLADEDALHLTKFHWFPPGDYAADWLTSHGKRVVASGKDLELADQRAAPPTPSPPGLGAGGDGTSLVEKRLSALRARAPRVSFADPPAHPISGGQEGRPRGREAGTGGGSRASGSQEVALTAVKREVEEILDSEGSDQRKRSKKKKDLGSTLAKAAQARRAVEAREEKKKKRSRSRSGSKKRKSKKKKRSSSSDNSRSKDDTSSSDESLMAPLKKRSRRHPGSIYKMLEETAVERLSADGVVEEGYESQGLRGQRPKMLTFFQIVLKPHLDPRTRDYKELSMLARSLDLLRDGRLAELADVLSSRLIAIDTASRQGWQVARHLEVFDEGEENTAPAHVLLAAQKHARQVQKAGGKGSWGRSDQWGAESWGLEPRPKGKGKEIKGKGKKGKGKGKPWKGQWGNWSAEGKDKTADGKKKPEGDA